MSARGDRRSPQRPDARRLGLGLGAVVAGSTLALGLVSQPAMARPDMFDSPSAGAGTKGQVLSGRLQILAGDPTLLQASPTRLNQTLGLSGEAGPAALEANDSTVLVYVRVGGASAGEALRAIRTLPVLVASVDLPWITVRLRPRDLRTLAAVPGVASVTEALKPVKASTMRAASTTAVRARSLSCAVGLTSEAETQTQAASARAKTGLDGTGVTIGVVSDSYNRVTVGPRAADDVLGGELPGAANPCGFGTPVRIVDEFVPSAGDEGSDEGRAMLQLAHDIAPGAELAFASGFNEGVFGMASNMLRLAKPVAESGGGADVVVDDLLYLNEPMFQQGPIDRAAATLRADGVPVISAAANSNVIVNGQNVGSYEAPGYRTTACPARLLSTVREAVPSTPNSCMNFGGRVTGTDSGWSFTLPPGGSLTPVLQWAEPWGGVKTDLDLYLVDETPGSNFGRMLNPTSDGVPYLGVDDNKKTQMPFEVLTYTNTSGSTKRIGLVAQRFSGAAPRIKMVLLGADVTSAQYNQSTVNRNGQRDVVGPSIYGHNGGPNVLSVGAIDHEASATAPRVADVRPYSSRGPLTLRFGPLANYTITNSGGTAGKVTTAPAAALAAPQLVNKPDLIATDGSLTSFFGDDSGDGFRFFGTSAAAPHVAGIVALVRQAIPTMSPAAITNLLKLSATPVAGANTSTVGAGLINAAAALTDPIAGRPTAVAVAGGIKVSWRRTGLPVQRFGVTCSAPGRANLSAIAPSTASSATVKGATPGVRYACRVGGVLPSTYGWSAAGPRSAYTVVALAIPTRPVNVTAASTARGQIRVAFTSRPSVAAPITSNVALCSSPGRPTRNATGLRSPLTVVGLVPGGRYTCSVVARNSVGNALSVPAAGSVVVRSS